MPSALDDVSALKRAKGGSTPEESPVTNEAGWYVYKNPDTLEVIDRTIAVRHAKFGDAQADALVRVGYKFERQATLEEMLAVRPNPVDDRQTHSSGGQTQSIQGDTVPRSEFETMKARLDLLEAERAQTPETEAPSETPLEDMTRAQLVNEAGKRGVTVPSGASKQDILEMVQDAKSE